MAAHLIAEIVSPDGRVFQGEISGLRAPGTAGSFEVLLNHAPMVASIDVGPIIVTDTNGEKITLATSGGYLEVMNNTVTVLAETAELAEEIDVERAEAAEQRALGVLEEEGDREARVRAEKALDRARNRLRIAMARVGTSR